MATVQLTRGYTAVIDDDDVQLVVPFSWHARLEAPNWYACRLGISNADEPRMVYLHRAVVGAVRGQIVDHIDGDTLNNRRSNLRIVSRSQNAQNRGSHRGASSLFPGVTLHRRTGKWQAQCRDQYLGLFATELEAAAAYQVRAKSEYGEFLRPLPAQLAAALKRGLP